jgi:tol-pal system protein YbgF
MSNRSILQVALLALSGLILHPADMRGWAYPAIPLQSSYQAAVTSPAGHIHLAQVSEAAVRVNQMEEQLRALNGRVEELTFQMLQLQEELRRMQQDNEYRFQELEERHGNVVDEDRRARQPSTATARTQGPPADRNNMPAEQGGGSDDSIGRMLENESTNRSAGRTLDGVELYDRETADSSREAPGPRALGALVFDEEGNIVDSQMDKPIDLTRRSNRPDNSGGDNNMLGASGELSASADELYELGYNYIQAGDYELAENIFGTFAERYPDDPRIPEARFWLGESLNAQGQHESAARVFLAAHKQYPNSRMGAQTLMKLGVALAGMEQRELACATFAEVPEKYPDLSNAMRENLTTQQNAASC